MTRVAEETEVADIPRVIRIDEEQRRGHVDQVVRESVEETLDAILKCLCETAPTTTVAWNSTRRVSEDGETDPRAEFEASAASA